jgi:hypothetical protein
MVRSTYASLLASSFGVVTLERRPAEYFIDRAGGTDR